MISYSLGVDPDLHQTGIGLLDSDREIVLAEVVKIDRNLKSRAASLEMACEAASHLAELISRIGPEKISVVTVEGQKHIFNEVRPDDLINLATVSGAILSVCSLLLSPPSQILHPTPVEWKGSVPKRIHQARVFKKLGLGYEQKRDYSAPLPFLRRQLGVPNIGAWKHIGDAIGLALWGMEKC